MKFLRLCLVFLVLTCLGGVGCATESWGYKGSALTGQVWVDPQGQMGPEDVLAQLRAGQGQAYSPTTFYPTDGPRAVWFWLDLPAQAMRAPSVLLIAYPGLNSLQLFEPGTGGASWRVLAAGDDLPVASWPIPHLFPAMPLAASAEPDSKLLLRVQHSHPVTLPWRIEERSAFEAGHQRLVLLLGMYLGLVALVVVLGVLNSVTLREPIHAVYAAYVVSLALTQSTLTGVSGLFFWPGNAQWNEHSATVLPMLSVAAAAWFARAVVSPLPARWLGWLLWAYVAAGLTLAALFAGVGRESIFRLANYYFLVGIPLCMSVLVWYARARSVLGWWFVAGFASLYVGALFTALRNLGLMPMNIATQYGAQIGAGLEIPLLLIGLYLRSRERRDALVRRAALQTRDPITGLANDRMTRERVDHLVQRLSLQPGRACVMRVRVGNIREILAGHGVQVTAGATLHAASCLTLITREADTVGRLKDGDFVLILERTLTEGEAMQEAARVVARGLAYSPRMPAGVPLRFFVALTLTAHEPGDVETLLADLDYLLDDIAETPQRVIRIATSVNAPASREVRLRRA